VQVIKTLSLLYTFYKSLEHTPCLLRLLSPVVSRQRISTVETLQLLCSRRCPLANTAQLNCLLNHSAICSQSPIQNSTELIALTILIITSRHEPHRKHSSSTVACAFVAAGTCLPSCSRERPLHSNGCTHYGIDKIFVFNQLVGYSLLRSRIWIPYTLSCRTFFQ
jgi:hypothetical protein